MGGIVDFRWHPHGLHCKLSIPHDNKRKGKRQAVAEPPVDSGGVPDALRKLVLLVEDEPTVSMMLTDLLSKFGHKVDGPYNRFNEAMVAARTNNVQAGVLDINVGGEKIYPLAEVLIERNIPFVFVTGYSADSINSRFSHVPVLQKPNSTRGPSSDYFAVPVCWMKEFLLNWFGLTPPEFVTSDSGYAYALAGLGIIGLIIFWALLMSTKGSGSRFYLFRDLVGAYFAVLLCISNSPFTIKTGALLWLLVGVLSRASDVGSRLRSTRPASHRANRVPVHG